MLREDFRMTESRIGKVWKSRASRCSVVTFPYHWQALRELFVKIGSAGEWQSGGGIADSIFATVEDYLSEYVTYLQPAFATRCSLLCSPLPCILVHLLPRSSSAAACGLPRSRWCCSRLRPQQHQAALAQLPYRLPQLWPIWPVT